MAAGDLAKRNDMTDTEEITALVLQAWLLASIHQAFGSAELLLVNGLRWANAGTTKAQQEAKERFILVVRMFLEDNLVKIEKSGGTFVSPRHVDKLRRLSGMEG